jgi:type I restriction enzyme, S subunit
VSNHVLQQTGHAIQLLKPQCLSRVSRLLSIAFDITQAEQRPGAYPVISSSGVTSFHDEFKASGPGVVISRKGTLGSIHFTAGDYWPHDTTLWSKDLKENSPRFVYFFLHTLDFKRFDVGNPNLTLNRNHIHEIPIRIPPRPVQEQIADMLSAYDDLMENNRRRMALLEESARLLYREWFVRLRFPGHEHTRLLNGIPEGWERKTLGDICTDIRETISAENLEPNTPYIGLEHIPRRSISLTEWGTADLVTSSKHLFRIGDILFGKIRPYFHKVGITFTNGVASSDAIVIRPNTDDLGGFVLMTVSSDVFVAEASQTMRAGSKMPRADWKLMTKYPVALPPQGIAETFTETLKGITDQLRNLCFQNQKLKAARDLLLPRLMSGEIAV